MKKTLFLIVFVLAVISCSQQNETNPFFTEWDTPFGLPPFEEIKDHHFMPALKEGIAQHNKEIEAIVNNPEEPTFENTLAAIDRSAQLIKKVNGVFFNLTSANTNDSLKAIAGKYNPLLTAHNDEMYMNVALFERVKAVNDKRDELNLSTEQAQLLKKVYRDFISGGVGLEEDDKNRLKEINERLSVLKVEFDNNLMAETNAFEMIIEDPADLAGLPEQVIQSASDAAEKKGYSGKWLFTTHKPSMIPFIQYAENRELRKKIYNAYCSRGDNNNENDNKKVIEEVIALRIEKANLLGYDNWSEFVLEDRMAKNADNVLELLTEIWEPALELAKKERDEMQQMIHAEGGDFSLQPWDWWYYAEKVKMQKYNLSEEDLKPYFELENVREGMFELANRLYGIQMIPLENVPVYHPDVKVYEVKEANGDHIGILITDYYVRDNKQGGAWMNSYRKQHVLNDEMIDPIIVNVCNFPVPDKDGNSFLSFDNVLTMFHEFGHGLHGLLSNCNYYKLSGTAVPRDFVELPSQIMENWVYEPEMLKMFAKHYQTGETIPDELIQKIGNSVYFNQGFATVEYVAASLLDMEWHTLSEAPETDINTFEKQALDKYGLIPEIVSRYRTTYFLHIFSHGNSSGYYGYLWAQVLDADAFEAFKETSLFSAETGQKFRDNILSRGGTNDAMILYKNFRGREPEKEPLLRRKGLI